jgi:hypothetical protein
MRISVGAWSLQVPPALKHMALHPATTPVKLRAKFLFVSRAGPQAAPGVQWEKETPRLEPQFNVRWKIIMKFYTATWRVRHTWLMPRRRAGLLLELPDVARLPRLLPRGGGWLTRFDM